MAKLTTPFDATQVDPAKPLEPVPAGDYQVQIIQSEIRVTRAGTGQYYALDLEILDGEHQGRRLWDRIMFEHPSVQAVAMGEGKFSAICHSIGNMNVEDTEELHFKPMVAVVKLRPAGPDKSGVERDASNDIKGYKPVADGSPAPRPPSSAPSPAAPPAAVAGASAGATTPPWQRSQ